MKKYIKYIIIVLLLCVVASVSYYGYSFYKTYVYEKELLKKIVARLEADSRIAQVIVVNSHLDPTTQKQSTKIKFLEFDSKGIPLDPKYFLFSDNIIQFQSLVVRFDDKFVKHGDVLKGKSAYLFWKAFVLDGKNTEEHVIADVKKIPSGYKIEGQASKVESEIWSSFWEFALDPSKAITRGIKNAQIEAPGTKFVEGYIYTLKIEHDGGIRIDVQEIPLVMRGESF